MKTLKNFYRRHKKAVLIISTVLITALVVGFLVASTNLVGYIANSNLFDTRDRNADNLIDVASYEELDGDKFNGVEFTLDEDGVIVLDGTATEDTEIHLWKEQTHKLTGDPYGQHDEYTYFSGCIDGSLDSYYLCYYAVPLDGESPSVTYPCFDGKDPMIYTFNDGLTESMVSIVITKGTELNNVKFYPLLSLEEGTTYFD